MEIQSSCFGGLVDYAASDSESDSDSDSTADQMRIEEARRLCKEEENNAKITDNLSNFAAPANSPTLSLFKSINDIGTCEGCQHTAISKTEPPLNHTQFQRSTNTMSSQMTIETSVQRGDYCDNQCDTSRYKSNSENKSDVIDGVSERREIEMEVPTDSEVVPRSFAFNANLQDHSTAKKMKYVSTR